MKWLASFANGVYKEHYNIFINIFYYIYKYKWIGYKWFQLNNPLQNT